MIVEHEVIEQIEENALGQRLDWVCALIRDLGREDPLDVLRGMWRAGHVTFIDHSGEPLPHRKSTELFREGSESAPVSVLATPCGSKWVHG